MWLLRKLSFPISLVYATVVYIRNYLFDVGILKSNTYKTPIVCVGNLSVGGTGKTPMIEFLIALCQENFKIAVLSRGYGRKSKGFVLANDATKVFELGDEPFQIHTKHPNVSVAVDEDRQNGITILENEIAPNLILLDDAFQHRKVKPSRSILLTAYGQLYCDDWYLPTGDLRDSKREAKRANVIIITKCPENIEIEEQEKIIKKLKSKEHQKVLFSYLSYGKKLIGIDGDLSFKELKNKSITLVTGIASPKPLVSFLESKQIQHEHLKYKDHHFFSEKEIELFNTKEIVITTEKDFSRLNNKVKSLYYITVEHKFLNNGKEVLKDEIMTIKNLPF